MEAPYKLVLADDDDEIRNGLFTYFPWNSLGFDPVYQAEDGQQAFSYILAHSIDVLLCDIRMPRMNGLELAKALRSLPGAPYIILLSAYQDFAYAQQAIASGVHGYIVKTAKFDELVSIFTDLKRELDARAAESRPASPQCSCPNVIVTVCEYIQKSFATATLDAAARLVYLSPFHLSKLFRQAMGLTFSSYLLQSKMENAAAFLRGNKYKTYQVSSLVGYVNPKNFARAFKAYYGITPNDYRNGVEPLIKRNKAL